MNGKFLVVAALAVCGLLSCEQYHHVWTLEGKEGVRYFTVPGHDDPREGATYVTNIPDADCQSDNGVDQRVCLTPASTPVGACTQAACDKPGLEERHVRVSVFTEEDQNQVRVTIDGGTCPVPLDAIRPQIDRELETARCSPHARAGIAAIVRRQFPRNFAEAVRDNEGLHGPPELGVNGRFIELLPGIRLRWERDTFLSPDGSNASGDSTYVTLWRAADGKLGFDPLLDLLDITVNRNKAGSHRQRSLVAASVVDLNSEPFRRSSWYLLFPQAAAESQKQNPRVGNFEVLVGSDDRSQLEKLATGARDKCLVALCSADDSESPDDACGDVNADTITCVQFPARSFVIPESHATVNGTVRYFSVGTTLGVLLSATVGDAAGALSHRAIHLDRWWNGRYVRVVLPKHWNDIPVLGGDRISW